MFFLSQVERDLDFSVFLNSKHANPDLIPCSWSVSCGYLILYLDVCFMPLIHMYVLRLLFVSGGWLILLSSTVDHGVSLLQTGFSWSEVFNGQFSMPQRTGNG